MKRFLGVGSFLLLLSGAELLCAQVQASSNTTLVIYVQVTIAKNVYIQWGASTSNDDTPAARANTITPFLWIVQSSADTPSSMLQCAETNITSSGAPNNKTIYVSNTSRTNSNADVTAQVTTVPGGWNVGGAAGSNQFWFRANMSGAGNGTVTIPSGSAADLTSSTLLAKGTDQALILTVDTPTDTTQNIGSQKQFVITLTASAP